MLEGGFGEGSGTEGSAASPPDRFRRPDLFEAAADVFNPGAMPEELRERLIRHGFILIDSFRLFAADRFVMLDNVASVEEGAVRLKVSRDQLSHRKM